MEASIALAGGALVSSFAAAFLMASTLWTSHERSVRFRNSQKAVDGKGGNRRIASILRNGIPIAIPFSRALLKSPRIGRLVSEMLDMLEMRDVVATRQGLLSALVAAIAALACLAALVAGSLVCGLAVAACICAIIVVRVNSLGEKRRFELRQSVPDTLSSMQTCFQSGYSLLQTFQQVALESEGPIGELFSHSAHQLQMGATATETLDYLRGKASIPELSFVAVALDVQHQAGGSMREVLDSAREMIEDELELSRKLRIQTAQAKLSARVVTIIPFVLIAVFSLISEDFLAPFFSSFMGISLLASACSMQLIGVLIVRRMLKIKE